MTLRTARENAELTQVELAEKAGTTQNTISALELGKIRRPAYDLVVRIARALDVPPEKLFPVEDGDAA